MNILLVDDSSTIRLLIKKTLSEHKGEVFFNFFNAENGQVALDILEFQKIDIAFVDWHMPVMDGEALIDILRNDKRFIKMKIIIATAESDKTKVVKMLKQGVNGYLLKPFEKGAIVKAFETAAKKLN